jgi:hypothetical protein
MDLKENYMSFFEERIDVHSELYDVRNCSHKKTLISNKKRRSLEVHR